MKSVKLFTVLIILFLSQGCASIVSKSKWPIVVSSNPTGAVVSITNKKGVVVYNGSTPAALTLKSGNGYFSKEAYLVKLSMDGYDEKVIPLECRLNDWYFGNILIGGLIGLLVVDPATGAMYRLNTDAIHENLSMTSASTTPSLKIFNINEVPQAMRKYLACLN